MNKNLLVMLCLAALVTAPACMKRENGKQTQKTQQTQKTAKNNAKNTKAKKTSSKKAQPKQSGKGYGKPATNAKNMIK